MFNDYSHGLQLLRPLLNDSKQAQVLHIHLVGDGKAGKSVAAEWMIQLFKSFTRPNSKSIYRSKDVQRGRTRGVLTTSIRFQQYEQDGKTILNDFVVVVHDYGGQEEFLSNHANFLATDNSLYVIVVPLLEIGDSIQQYRVRTITEMLERYLFWCRFIFSVVRKEHAFPQLDDSTNNSSCKGIPMITVINKFGQLCNGDQYKTYIQSAIVVLERQLKNEFTISNNIDDSSCDFVVTKDIFHIIDNAYVHDMFHIITIIREMVDNTSVKGEQRTCAIIDHVITCYDSANHPVFMTEKQWIQWIYNTIVSFPSMRSTKNTLSKQQSNDLIHLVIDYCKQTLLTMNKLMILQYPVNDIKYVTNPSVLSTEILGDLLWWFHKYSDLATRRGNLIDIDTNVIVKRLKMIEYAFRSIPVEYLVTSMEEQCGNSKNSFQRTIVTELSSLSTVIDLQQRLPLLYSLFNWTQAASTEVSEREDVKGLVVVAKTMIMLSISDMELVIYQSSVSFLKLRKPSVLLHVNASTIEQSLYNIGYSQLSNTNIHMVHTVFACLFLIISYLLQWIFERIDRQDRGLSQLCLSQTNIINKLQQVHSDRKKFEVTELTAIDHLSRLNGGMQSLPLVKLLIKMGVGLHIYDEKRKENQAWLLGLAPPFPKGERELRFEWWPDHEIRRYFRLPDTRACFIPGYFLRLFVNMVNNKGYELLEGYGNAAKMRKSFYCGGIKWCEVQIILCQLSDKDQDAFIVSVAAKGSQAGKHAYRELNVLRSYIYTDSWGLNFQEFCLPLSHVSDQRMAKVREDFLEGKHALDEIEPLIWGVPSICEDVTIQDCIALPCLYLSVVCGHQPILPLNVSKHDLETHIIAKLRQNADVRPPLDDVKMLKYVSTCLSVTLPADINNEIVFGCSDIFQQYAQSCYDTSLHDIATKIESFDDLLQRYFGDFDNEVRGVVLVREECYRIIKLASRSSDKLKDGFSLLVLNENQSHNCLTERKRVVTDSISNEEKNNIREECSILFRKKYYV